MFIQRNVIQRIICEKLKLEKPWINWSVYIINTFKILTVNENLGLKMKDFKPSAEHT